MPRSSPRPRIHRLKYAALTLLLGTAGSSCLAVGGRSKGYQCETIPPVDHSLAPHAASGRWEIEFSDNLSSELHFWIDIRDTAFQAEFINDTRSTIPGGAAGMRFGGQFSDHLATFTYRNLSRDEEYSVTLDFNDDMASGRCVFLEPSGEETIRREGLLSREPNSRARTR